MRKDSQTELKPDLDSPVQRAGNKDLVVVVVPGDVPDGGGVGGVAGAGVGGTGDGELVHGATVQAQQQLRQVVRLEGQTRPYPCVAEGMGSV